MAKKNEKKKDQPLATLTTDELVAVSGGYVRARVARRPRRGRGPGRRPN